LGQGRARAGGLYPRLRGAGIRSGAALDLGGVDHRVRGGIALIIGLFTRFFAAAARWKCSIITMLYWKAGFSWLNRGYEYTLLWGLVCFAIALRGGGPYSIDRKIGVEL
jgi:Predicted membrane protein